MEEETIIQELESKEGVERVESDTVNGVFNLYVDYGVYDGTLSPEVLTTLGQWDATVYKPRPRRDSEDYQVVNPK